MTSHEINQKRIEELESRFMDLTEIELCEFLVRSRKYMQLPSGSTGVYVLCEQNLAKKLHQLINKEQTT
jgi:hypothetical protein